MCYYGALSSEPFCMFCFFFTMEQFIEETAKSFLENAPENTKLIFKVHPMDRGYKDYASLIDDLNRACGEERFRYLDRIHLPSALGNALGCITINSTVGLSALYHGAPTICLGQAIYDLKELTYQDSLPNFWNNRPPVNTVALKKFIYHLKETTQAHGLLSQKIFNNLPGESQIYWTPLYKELFTPLAKTNNVALKYEKNTISPPLTSTTDAY